MGESHVRRDKQSEFVDGLEPSWFNTEPVGAELNEWLRSFDQVPPHWFDRGLQQNHFCALESERRVLEMVEQAPHGGLGRYTHVMYVRPDVWLLDDLPVEELFFNREACLHEVSSALYIPLTFNPPIQPSPTPAPCGLPPRGE